MITAIHKHGGQEEMIPETIILSDAALVLLRQHIDHDDIRVNDANREIHRELACAGLLVVGHSFRDGREAFYRLTEIGRKFAAINGPWLEESAVRRP
jgi:hypothetical protein